jgi:hypothetical protein
MKPYLKKWHKYIKIDEMATRWKEEGLEGPYPLESGEMGGTLDVLKQYVTPDDEKATHFVHFGGVGERDVSPVKKKAASWSNQMVADPKLGPAKDVSAGTRQSKHGPQFKFGVNPSSQYNTPYGIYSYPLNQSIFRQLADGTLPFAQNEPYILLFKVMEGLPLIYTSQDIPDDEYKEYVEKLFSDEMLESEREARYKRANRKRAATPTHGNSYPYYPPLDFLRKANQQWQQRRPPWRSQPYAPGETPHPRDLPIVRQTEHETDQYMTDATKRTYTKTNSAYLWGLVRAAAHEDPIRWNMMMRKLGIGGVVDDLGTGHIHSAEPVQAVFFTKRDPDKNLELVEVLPNTHTKTKIERREQQVQQREIRDLVKGLIAEVHPDPKFKVTQEFVASLISYIGLRDDEWLFNPSKETDLQETIISLKEEGLPIITEYIIHSYANGTLMELSNAKIEWEHKMRKLGLLPVRLDIDNHPTTAFHHKTLGALRRVGKDFKMGPSLALAIEAGEFSARDLVQGSFNEIDEIQQEHTEVLRTSYEEALNAAGHHSDEDPDKPSTWASEGPGERPFGLPENPPAEDLSSLFENKKPRKLNYLGARWDWIIK